jgi:23S rRNA pseudouridine1911/1915/1917 synthase
VAGNSASRVPDRWRVSDAAAGSRLDTYVADVYRTSRSQVAKWIRAGRVLVGGRDPKPALRLEGGEWISCDPLPVEQPDSLEPEEGRLAIVYEDEQLVVLDKPADLVVHPGAGRPTGTLAHRLLGRYPEIAEVGGPGRPGIVHRLDRGTSGVMVVARTTSAYHSLSTAFAERRVTKTYLALVWGRPDPPSGRIDMPIARHPVRRKEMTVSRRGRPALTSYSTLASTAVAAALELDLATGRTHQIRVHLKQIGHPIIGDPVYGEARWKALPKRQQAPLRDFPRPALHAWRLELPHPDDGRILRFEAPPAADLSALWQRLAGEPLPRGSS